MDKEYYITEEGLIHYQKDGNPTILKPYIGNRGFKYVSLNGKDYLVHRLVYDYYYKDLGEKDTIIFIDGDKNNLHYTNLTKKKMKQIKVKYQVMDETILPDIEKDSLNYPNQKERYTFEKSNKGEFIDWINDIINDNDYIYFDTETNGLNQWEHEMLLLSFYNKKKNEAFIISGDRCSKFIDLINDTTTDVFFCGHNLMFDILFLMSKGLKLTDNIKLYDTYLFNRLLFNRIDLINHNGLDDILLREFNVSMNDLGSSFALVDYDTLKPMVKFYNITTDMIIYAIEDITYLPNVLERFIALTKGNNMVETFKNEHLFLKELIQFSFNGIPIDINKMDEVFNATLNLFLECRKEGNDVGLDFYNKTEIINTLLSIGYELPITKNGAYSLKQDEIEDMDTLEEDTKDILGKYLKFRKLQKSCAEINNKLLIINEENEKILSKRKKDGLKIYNKRDYKKYQDGIISLEDVKINKGYQLKNENDLNELIHNKKYKLAKEGKKLSLDEYVINGRIYPNIREFGTITNRVTITKPAMQNISRNAKKLVTAPNGKLLLSMDFKAQEPQIAAIKSKCPEMLQAYKSGDYHNFNCKKIYPYVEVGKSIEHLSNKEIKELEFKDTGLKFRDVIKIISLGILYGMETYTFLSNLNLPRTDENIQSIEHLAALLKTDKLNNYWIMTAHELVRTGRIRFGGKFEYYFECGKYFEEIRENGFDLWVSKEDSALHYKFKDKENIDHYYKNKLKERLSKISRYVKNYPIQGAAAASLRYIIPNLMKQIRENNIDAQIAHLIHDEIVLEVNENISDETINDIVNKIIDLNSEFFETSERIIIEQNKDKNQKK